MDKKILLGLAAALLLGACAPTTQNTSSSVASSEETSSISGEESSSEISSSSEPRTDILATLENGYRMNVAVTIGEGKKDATIFVGKDFFTYLGKTAEGKREARYFENREGKAVELSLDSDAKEIESIMADDYSALPLAAPLGFYEGEIIEDGDYPLDTEKNKTDIVYLAYLLSGMAFGDPTDAALKINEAKLVRDGEKLTLVLKLEAGDGTAFEAEAELTPDEKAEGGRFGVPAESEASKMVDAALDSLLDQNYTLTIGEGATASKLYATADKVYIETPAGKGGIVATAEGTDILSWDADKGGMTLTGSSENALRTYLPDFDVDGRVFEMVDDHLEQLPFASGVAEHFSFDAYDFLDVTLSEGISLYQIEGGYRLVSGDDEITVTAIGTTEIPVDMSYSLPSEWENESQEIQDAIKDLIGDLNLLPYWDTGYAWDTINSFSGGTDIECSEVPDDEVVAAMNSYAAVCRESEGLTELTFDEYNEVAYSYGMDEGFFFQIGDVAVFEIYDAMNAWSVGVGISITAL